jgi:hypothetical protein
MERELGEVQRRFATVPLFDRALAHELAALEKRQTSGEAQPRLLSTSARGSAEARGFNGALDSGGGSSPSPVPGRAPLPAKPRSGGTTFRLPEKLQRPWSVEVLLNRGEAIVQSQTHPQAHKFLRHEVEDPASPAGGNRHEGRYSPARLEHYHGGHDADVSPYPSARHSRSPSTRSHRKKKGSGSTGTPRVQRGADVSLLPNRSADMMRGGDGHSTEDEYYKPEADFAMEETIRLGLVDPESHSHNTSGTSSQLLLQSGRATTMPINLDVLDETIEAQIERAAVRHRLRKDRLHAVNKRGPDEVAVIAVQTEPQLTNFVPDNLGVEKQKKSSFGTQVGKDARTNVRGSATAASSQPLLLNPEVPYSPITLQSSLRSDATVWQKLAMHEAHPELAQASSAAQDVRFSSSNVGGGRSGDLATGGPSASPLADARSKVMTQLDRIQLENEEMLIRNQMLDPNMRLQDPNEQRLAREAVAHVGAAHRVEVPKPKIGPPQGGYGSLADPHQGLPQYAGGAASWSDAREDNKVQDWSTSATIEPLRRWSTDLASSRHDPVGTILPSSRSSLKSLSSGINQSTEYNARRKWQNVSFSTAQLGQPNQQFPPNMLDTLSSGAKSMMSPTE